MNIPVRNREFLRTTPPTMASLWDEVLSLQVALLAPAEFQVLGGLAAWRRAVAIADAGCGNGAYVSALARAFPDRSYTGIDQSDELIERAQEQAGVVQFRAATLDRLADHGSFDVVLLRFVLQHQRDLAALDASARALRPGGHVVIIEPLPRRSSHSPDTPGFFAAMTAFEAARAAAGYLRPHIDRLDSLVAGHGWEIAADAMAVAEHPAASIRPLLLGWVDLCGGLVRGDLCERAREEVAVWADNPVAISRIALRILVARPAPSRGQ